MDHYHTRGTENQPKRTELQVHNTEGTASDEQRNVREARRNLGPRHNSPNIENRRFDEKRIRLGIAGINANRLEHC